MREADQVRKHEEKRQRTPGLRIKAAIRRSGDCGNLGPAGLFWRGQPQLTTTMYKRGPSCNQIF